MIINGTRPKILIVEDDTTQRALLRMCLPQEEYYVFEAKDGKEALKLLEINSDIRLVITDLCMPVMDGFELIEKIRNNEFLYRYIIVHSSMEEEFSLIKALSLGADDYLAKPVRLNELLLRIKSGIRLLRLESHEELVFAMAKLSEYRSDETGYHLERVQHYTRLLALDLNLNCPELNISSSLAEEIARVSSLHDIGKVAIQDSILHKPGPLTDAEFTTMKEHTVLGGNILKDIYEKTGSYYLKVACEIARHHHERYNGNGYPEGLCGDDIPVSARIMALADIYDAMTTERCYKSAFSHEKARETIISERGHHLDPRIVDSFLRQEDIWLSVKDHFQDQNDSADFKNLKN